MSTKITEKLSTHQIEMLASAWLSFKEGREPENSTIDFDKMAILMGMTTGSANRTWSTLKAKLRTVGDEIVNGSGDGADTPAPACRKKGKSKAALKHRSGLDDGDGDGDGQGDAETRMKKRARKGGKAARNVVEDAAAAEDGRGVQPETEEASWLA